MVGASGGPGQTVTCTTYNERAFNGHYTYYPCECGSVYVGETGRHVKTCIEEHKRAVMKADPSNAIAEHVWSTGHKIQWDETTSIDPDGDWFRRRVKETLYIRSSNAMNSDPGPSLNQCWTAPRTAPSNNDRH